MGALSPDPPNLPAGGAGATSEPPHVNLKFIWGASPPQTLPIRKNMGSNFQPVKEETLFEKWKKKDQKKSESKPNQLKLIYNYFYYLPTVVKKMIIMDFKVELEIMMLPKEEKSYREKELRNTLINKHHEIYMDAKFPENKEQTLRVKKILTRNIELSDPKTFKDPKPVFIP